MTDAAFARRAIALLDLTDLSNGLDEAGVEWLCARAVTPLGPVAAVCLWAGFVPQARRLLRGTPVRIATVVNFPAGEDDVIRAADEARYALLDGADDTTSRQARAHTPAWGGRVQAGAWRSSAPPSRAGAGPWRGAG